MGKGRGKGRGLGDTFAKLDLDDVFSYSTLHFTTIRDRRLGLLSLLLKVGIVVYLVYQLLGEGGYLRIQGATGQARFSLMNPTSNCTYEERRDASVNASCAFCDPVTAFLAGKPCYDAFPNVAENRYCTQSPIPYEDKGRKKRLCKYSESQGSQTVFQESILVITSAVQVEEKRSCSVDPKDPLYDNGICNHLYTPVSGQERSTHYYGDIENFELGVHHSLSFPQQVAGQDLEVGRLYVTVDPFDRSNTDTLCQERGESESGGQATESPCYLPVTRDESGYDRLVLSDLLLASHVSLDKVLSGAYTDQVRTVRDVGTTIVVHIEYDNWNPWDIITGEVRPTYRYRPIPVYNNTFQSTTAIYEKFPAERSLVYQNGVHVVAEQSGTIADFDFMTTMITLTTSLTILAVAAKITDILATTVLPGKELYSDYKNNKTPDMSDVRCGLTCATCNRPLIPVYAGARSSGMVTRSCGTCAVEMNDGEAMYMCSRCDNLRCPLCLMSSTLNTPPQLPVQVLARNLFGTGQARKCGARHMTYDNVLQMYKELRVCELVGKQWTKWGAPPPREDYTHNWLEEALADEKQEVRSAWQSLLVRYAYAKQMDDMRHLEIEPMWSMTESERDEYKEALKERYHGTEGKPPSPVASEESALLSGYPGYPSQQL